MTTIINEKIKFDNNADIIGFDNGVYDLIKHEFRPTKYSDYITITCGYNYNDKIDSNKMFAFSGFPPVLSFSVSSDTLA